MKKLNALHWTLITIGSLSVISGAYLGLTGEPFGSYFSGITVGISMIGASIIHANDLVQLPIEDGANCQNFDNNA